jgi:hypothetical protein
MSHPERMITPSEVKSVLMKGEIIEDYPTDPRGHSCLLIGFADDVTAYRPDPEQWSRDFRKRL